MTTKTEPRGNEGKTKLVYVVDDQPSALRAIVILMRTLGSEWKVVGFSNPLEALAAVKTHLPDLVLSDLSMPEMMGSDLLEEVRKAAPHAVRMVMSGWVDLNKLSKIGSAHQYFAKPFDSIKLKELIRRTFAARASIQDDGLRQLVVSLRSLPSLPHVYQTLLVRLADEAGSSDVVAGMVAQDVGLSTKLLQLANSPLFGRGTLVTDPFEAVLCLGTELIKAVILSQELMKRYATLRHPDLDASRLWSHCWDVAELAQYICRQKTGSRFKAEEAFLAGLLHEIGMFILLDNFPEQFQSACHSARTKRCPLAEELANLLKASPGQVGAYLLDLWGVPASVSVAVADHEHPERKPHVNFSLTAALYIANQIAARKTPLGFALTEWNTEYLRSIECLEDIPQWEQL